MDSNIKNLLTEYKKCGTTPDHAFNAKTTNDFLRIMNEDSEVEAEYQSKPEDMKKEKDDLDGEELDTEDLEKEQEVRENPIDEAVDILDRNDPRLYAKTGLGEASSLSELGRTDDEDDIEEIMMEFVSSAEKAVSLLRPLSGKTSNAEINDMLLLMVEVMAKLSSGDTRRVYSELDKMKKYIKKNIERYF